MEKLKKKNVNEPSPDPLTVKSYCYGNPYYGIFFMLEQDMPGDGFKGEYFDNEGFYGKPVENHERVFDFDWDGKSPLEGINNINFSVMYIFELDFQVT